MTFREVQKRKGKSVSKPRRRTEKSHVIWRDGKTCDTQTLDIAIHLWISGITMYLRLWRAKCFASVHVMSKDDSCKFVFCLLPSRFDYISSWDFSGVFIARWLLLKLGNMWLLLRKFVIKLFSLHSARILIVISSQKHLGLIKHSWECGFWEKAGKITI